MLIGVWFLCGKALGLVGSGRSLYYLYSYLVSCPDGPIDRWFRGSGGNSPSAIWRGRSERLAGNRALAGDLGLESGNGNSRRACLFGVERAKNAR